MPWLSCWPPLQCMQLFGHLTWVQVGGGLCACMQHAVMYMLRRLRECGVDARCCNTSAVFHVLVMAHLIAGLVVSFARMLL